MKKETSRLEQIVLALLVIGGLLFAIIGIAYSIEGPRWDDDLRSHAWQEGYEEGFDAGYYEGYQDGHEMGEKGMP